MMLGTAHTAFHTTENLYFQKTNQYRASKEDLNFIRKACLFHLLSLLDGLGMSAGLTTQCSMRMFQKTWLRYTESNQLHMLCWFDDRDSTFWHIGVAIGIWWHSHSIANGEISREMNFPGSLPTFCGDKLCMSIPTNNFEDWVVTFLDMIINLSVKKMST